MKRETIDKFLYHNVTLTDCNGMVMSGYFVPYGKKYKLFPENSGWDTYVYRPSHIRKIVLGNKRISMENITNNRKGLTMFIGKFKKLEEEE